MHLQVNINDSVGEKITQYCKDHYMNKSAITQLAFETFFAQIEKQAQKK